MTREEAKKLVTGDKGIEATVSNAVIRGSDLHLDLNVRGRALTLMSALGPLWDEDHPNNRKFLLKSLEGSVSVDSAEAPYWVLAEDFLLNVRGER
jgi:hypothetical protein